MNLQVALVVVQIAMFVVMAMGGWLMMVIWGSIKAQRDEVASLSKELWGEVDVIKRDYVRRDDFSAFAERIEKAIAGLEKLLRGEAKG